MQGGGRDHSDRGSTYNAPGRLPPDVALGPGKRTLVEQAPRGVAPAVQRKSREPDDGSDPSAVHANAARGIAGPGAPLPHLDTIQRVFGRHDVSGVRAHMDTAAAKASAAIGAEAYAAGDDIAFTGIPSLHTAAHEAAHIVQQRRGISLAGGVGAAGDPYERHADAIADRVVAGQPVEHLLDSAPGGTAGSSAVQRSPQAGQAQKGAPTKPAVELDPSEPFRTMAGGEVWIRVSWLQEDPACDVTRTRITAPTKTPIVMRALKGAGFWWMTDEAIARSKDLSLEGPIDPVERPILRSGLAATAFEILGLPPDLDVTWMFEDNSGYEMFSASALQSMGDLPNDQITIRIPPELTQRSIQKLSAMVGHPVTWSGPVDRLQRMDRRDQALVLEHNAAFMRGLLGKHWDGIIAHPPKKESERAASQFDGRTFANTISIEDRQYFQDWVKRVYGNDAPKGLTTPADAAIISTLRRIDGHPLKDQILAQLKGGAGSGAAVDWVRLEELVHHVEESAERARMGLTAASAPGHRRQFERPITGEIVNLGSLASVGKELQLYFATSDRQGIGFCGITVWWFASPIDEPTRRVREGTTYHFAHHTPEKWSVTFDEVGKYRIVAFVDHVSYWPAHFETFIEVKTEAERLTEVEDHAFADIGKPDKRTRDHFFEVSFTNDRFGDNKYTFGDVTEGELPKDFKHRSLEERIAFIANDRQKLQALLKERDGRTDSESLDLIKYAKHALDKLDDTQSELTEDAKGMKTFEVRGAFLSEKNGVRSGDLNLIGLAGERDLVAAGVHVGQTPTVRIHDLSQLYEPKDAVYTGQDTTFRAAVEKAFVELCKSYPPGRVSIQFEQLRDADYQPTGKTMGFELHTGTAWKSVRATVWDGKVQLVVNLVAAATSVFIPGAALVTMALVTAYNATDTLATLADLERKGQATWKDKVEAGVMIGIDILPFVGKLTKAGQLGGKAVFALDAMSTAGTVAVLTEQGVRAVGELRDQYITEIARLQAEIEDLERVNDSDPRIAEKKQALKELIEKARSAGTDKFQELASQGAIMVMVRSAFNHMIEGARPKAVDELEKAGIFVHEKGVEPHYDPVTKKIRGDRARVNESNVGRLHDAFLRDDGAAAPAKGTAAQGATTGTAASTANEGPHNRPTDKMPAQDVPPSERVTDRRPTVEPPPSERPTVKMPAVESAPTHAPDGSVRVKFLGSGDTAAEAAGLVKPLPGYVDVFVHSESGSFLVLHNGEWIPVKANSVRQLILKHPAYRKGQAIRLIACEAGSPTSILAQSIADGMGAHVIAPSDTVWVHPDGRLTIGPTHLEETGHWASFEPRDINAPVDQAPVKPAEADRSIHVDQPRDPAGPGDPAGTPDPAAPSSKEPTAMGRRKRPPHDDELPPDHEGNGELDKAQPDEARPPPIKPVADAGSSAPATLRTAPEAPAVQQAIAAANGQLGEKVDEGGFGAVYRVPEHPDLVIKLPKDDVGGQINPQLAKEAASLQRLTDAQAPTAYHGTVEWTDASATKRVGILMDYIEGAFSKNVLQQGKFAGSKIPEGHRELFNKRTVSDLENLRDRCLEQNIDIEDLQFMVSHDGSIRVVDPARVTWLNDAKMIPRHIKEKMRQFEKRIKVIINDVREIVRKNTGS